MKIFLLKILLFLLPLILFASVPVYIQLWSKEDFYNIDHYIKKTPQPSLVGYAYNEENYRYLKYKTIVENDPVDVMAIGSSRVLQFRHEMFSTSFYNVGYVIETIADFEQFLSILPINKLPRTLIIGLDQWMFNPNNNKILRPNPTSYWQNNLSLNRKKSVQNFLRIYKDVVTKKIVLSSIGTASNVFNVGLYASLDSSGFRPDGSFYYGRQIAKLEANDTTASDFQFHETLARVENGIVGFEHGSTLNKESVKVFADCVEFCQYHNIRVICFLPPFADAVYERMIKNGTHTYLNQIEPELQRLTQVYNVEFYSYNNVSACGSSDAECIDGRHGSEKTYMRLLIDMLKQNSILTNVCDAEQLQRNLDHANSNHTVFSNY